MSEINKDFITLSTQISEVNGDRHIDSTKLEVNLMKESVIRLKNDEILEDKINITVQDFGNEILKITNEFNQLKNNIQLLNNDDSDNIDNTMTMPSSLDDAQNIINNKQNNINNLKIQLVESMRKMTNKIQEQDNLEKTNASKELIDSVKNDIANLSNEVDKTNDLLSSNIKDIKLLEDATIELEKSKILNEIEKIHNEMNDQEKLFNIMNDENDSLYKINMEVIETFENIYLNFQKLDTTKHKEKINIINEQLNFYKTRIDLEKLSVRKLNLQKDKILSEMKDLISNNFTNLEEVIVYKNKALDNLKTLQGNNKVLMGKNNISEEYYNELKEMCNEIDKLYKQVVEYQNETLKLKEEIEKLKDELNRKLTEKEEVVEEKEEVVEEKEEVVEEKEEVVEEKEEVVEERLPILEKIYTPTMEMIELPDKLTNVDSMSDSEILNIFNNSIQDLKNIPNLDYSVSINNITAEDTNLEAKDIKKIIIGKTVTANLKYNNLNIIGQGTKIKVNIFNKNKIINKISFNLKETDKIVDIINKEDALTIARKQYDEKFADNLKVTLCYHSFSNNNSIIPAYLISGKYQNIELLESIIPASLEYFPKISFGNISILSNSIKTINIDLPNNNDTDSNNIIKNKEITTENFKIHVNNLKSDSKVDVISIFNITNNLEEDSSFTISLNKNISTSFLERISKIKCILSTQNEFGFTFNIPLTLDLSKYSKLFNIISTRMENPTHGGSIHNYGIEWAEPHLGTNIYKNYIDAMNHYGVHKEYSVDSTESNQVDFKDYNNFGNDNYYIDNVDTSAYIGHGYGDGITFETSKDDSTLTSSDAKGGDAWGNRDMEFQALMSCKVLKETYDGKNWAERWGPVFNGLHLLCGFQTNASVGEHKMLQYFADNQYDKKQTVMNSWFNAANNDQPNDRQAVIMGPLIDNSNKDLYNSVEASTSGLYRAHWNDHAWGVKDGPSLDISKKNIKGWWRVVFTV